MNGWVRFTVYLAILLACVRTGRAEVLVTQVSAEIANFPEYAEMARRRIGKAQPPLFADVQAAQKESGAPCLDFA